MTDEMISHYEVRVPGEMLMTQASNLPAATETAKKYNKGKEGMDRACVFARYVSGHLSANLIPEEEGNRKQAVGFPKE